MQYTYSIVDAAALWAGVEPAVIRKRMDAGDLERIELDFEQAISDAENEDGLLYQRWEALRESCERCDRESSCPEYEWRREADGKERAILLCPAGNPEKPDKNPPPPVGVPAKRKLTKRLLPRFGEFHDLPKFEERLAWLQTALTRGDLLGSAEAVAVHSLKAWLQLHFPTEQPEFLFQSAMSAPSAPDAATLHEATVSREEKIGVRDLQVKALMAMVRTMPYDPLCIPAGEKQQLRRKCAAKHRDLFTGQEHQWDDIWTAARKRGLIRSAIHERSSNKKRGGV